MSSEDSKQNNDVLNPVLWFKSLRTRVNVTVILVTLLTLSLGITMYLSWDLIEGPDGPRSIMLLAFMGFLAIPIMYNLFTIRRSEIRRIENTMARLKEAEEQSKLVLDTTPLCCQIWSRDLVILDCNEAAVALYGFDQKNDFMERFIEFCLPARQPEGLPSEPALRGFINKAFDDGYHRFTWMGKMVSGTLLPLEITMVRINNKDDDVVAAYTRDLRDMESMMRQITLLRTEAEKIFIDDLTGIYNRRYFDKNLALLIRSLSRSGGNLSLMMIDIDNFKRYNDTYGHNEGDKCLKLIAWTLSACITRVEDFVIRYGGEEFAVILPNTDERGARVVAEKLLSSVEDKRILHEDNENIGYVTISIGVTCSKVSHSQTNEDYIKKADEMLYLSKRNGKNRYTFGKL
ncbi:MAG: GGDEF domain-containing protein [Treponema sp.]|nr:GGDEF domain-containing protein [Treponema sp.]